MARKELGRWQIGKSLIECHRYKLEQEIDCDVIFKLTNPETTHVGAHKYMLVTRSPVFEAMFSGNFKEMSEVTITDVESAAFRDLLRYIYTDEVNLCPGNALHVLAAAKKYLLDGLENICTAFLEDNICKDNACMLLDQSNLFGMEKLKKECLHLIAKETQSVFVTDDFLEVSQNGLLEILKQEGLNVETESFVYEECIEWAKDKAGGEATDIELREILGPCLYQIRFCTMKAEEFANTVGKSSILNGEEKSAFYSFILTKTNPGPLKEWGFNLNPRRSESFFCQIFEHIQLQTSFNHQSGQAYVVHNSGRQRRAFNGLQVHRIIRNQPNCIQNDYLRFEVDSPILMTGITVLGCSKGGQYDITFTMSHEQSCVKNYYGEPCFGRNYPMEEQLCLNKCITAIDDSQHLTFCLDKAHQLIPGSVYQVQVSVQNSPRPIYLAYNPQCNVSVQGVNFTFHQHGKHSQYAGNVYGSGDDSFITGIYFTKHHSQFNPKPVQSTPVHVMGRLGHRKDIK